MKTFQQLSAPVVDKIIRFNAIRYDLDNFLRFLSSTPPETLDLEYFQVIINDTLIKIYQHYENQNTSHSSNHLEDS